MSQRKLAEYLRLGEVTIARWESNRNVQTAAMDLLLKLIRDVPAAAKYIESDRAA
jgi:DNA-binding transcriptional regulator YiaG